MLLENLILNVLFSYAMQCGREISMHLAAILIIFYVFLQFWLQHWIRNTTLHEISWQHLHLLSTRFVKKILCVGAFGLPAAKTRAGRSSGSATWALVEATRATTGRTWEVCAATSTSSSCFASTLGTILGPLMSYASKGTETLLIIVLLFEHLFHQLYGKNCEKFNRISYRFVWYHYLFLLDQLVERWEICEHNKMQTL